MPEHYLRHPAEIPILLSTAQESQPLNFCYPLNREFSPAGLSCLSEAYISPGSTIEISTPLSHPSLSATGHVIWCQQEQPGFLLGIGFDDPDQAFSVRMIEQVCQIESYRLKQHRRGRQLSSEQAAVEWIRLHAADFAAIGELQ
ncbi:PilZ domain-containing protein [Amphritea pacifica]|uniref:PilZ domain-containing protein n=1 Tax=Amphritea pacifica TaxID=2811233 RepID=A0ABS2W987_9GAMM|nr:PilZ domain-containing protein [Amphritea pacifica]MBN0988265.1 PilZ domain-containing protein [Amphritea pacifica]